MYLLSSILQTVASEIDEKSRFNRKLKVAERLGTEILLDSDFLAITVKPSDQKQLNFPHKHESNALSTANDF